MPKNLVSRALSIASPAAHSPSLMFLPPATASSTDQQVKGSTGGGVVKFHHFKADCSTAGMDVLR